MSTIEHHTPQAVHRRVNVKIGRSGVLTAQQKVVYAVMHERIQSPQRSASTQHSARRTARHRLLKGALDSPTPCMMRRRRGMDATLRIGDVVAHRFRIGELLGSGAHGEVFAAHDNESDESIALKVDEKATSLTNESAIYDAIQQGAAPIHGFVKKIGFGHAAGYTWLAMERVGLTLEDMVDDIGGTSIRRVLGFGVQILRRLQMLHSRSFIHRDVKPSNIALGIDNALVYLIDFGLATRYMTPDNIHSPYLENRAFIGTRRFGSLNAHRGLALSRRDDLESLAYTLAYVYRGKLPWMGIKNARTKAEKHRITLSLKERLNPHRVFRDTRLIHFYHYVRALDFTTEPNYQYLVDLLLGDAHTLL